MTATMLCSCGRGVIVEWRCSACGTAGGARGLTRHEHLARLERMCAEIAEEERNLERYEAMRNTVGPGGTVTTESERSAGPPVLVIVLTVVLMMAVVLFGVALLHGWRQ